MFEDRAEAGERLAATLADRDIGADLVLAIPRGGLPVARPVADRLDAPLDIVAAKKLGMPGNAEFAIGAAASDGSVWLNDDIIDRHDIDESYLDQERTRAAETAREKIDRYRGARDPPEMAGKTVVVVDDGVATGATARACLRQVRNAGAERVVLAVPLGPPDSLRDLESAADAVVAVAEPQPFNAVGAHYRTFGQVTDEEAMAYLGWVAE
ncbi:Predicted phosphoribosyltransferase [Haloplanus vescus]|uniref:Predicted phosphoribosyltransferase n=1 Tax=Haloplanus vescus TaxID=555874 RepID=A0A1H3VPX5_9EURY|nr:phosphoribosyltransferase family protein [Haloplanus vescus]SDZ76284.1 Predicted phosphoribosyltransferase [Haloplanus vescus]